MSDTYKKLMQKIVETAADANKELGTVHEWYRASQEIGKRQAQDRLKALEAEYFNHVARDAVVIFTKGSKENQQRFSEVAEDEGNTVTVDAEELYRRIAARVFPSMHADPSFGSLQAMQARIEMSNIFDDTDIGTPDLPTFMKATGFRVISMDDCIEALRLGARLEYGDKINAAYLTIKAQKAALASGLDGDVVPIVVINATEDEQKGLEILAPGKTFLVEVTDGNVNANTVVKLFKQVKKKLLGVAETPNNPTP